MTQQKDGDVAMSEGGVEQLADQIHQRLEAQSTEYERCIAELESNLVEAQAHANDAGEEQVRCSTS